MSQIKISIQQADFSIEAECKYLRSKHANVGALVTFCGLVRDIDENCKVTSLFLEHYPGMTEKSLQDIAEQALQRWPLLDISIIHRVGELLAKEQIVFVGVSSQHRHAAFAACEFIMDYLKTGAPFWKKSRDEKGESWVEAKTSDSEASEKWR